MLKKIGFVLFVLIVFSGVSSADQVVENGDFETGDLTGWSDFKTSVSSSYAYEGSYGAQITSNSYTGYIYQDVNLTEMEELTFYYNIRFLNIDTNFYVYIGDVIEDNVVFSKDEYDDDKNWHKATIDISSYNGEQTLSFYVDDRPNDENGKIWIDNIIVAGPKPILLSPNDGVIINETYPPLLHSIDLQWTQSIDTSTYRYQVAEDDEFNQIVKDDYTAYTEATVGLEAGTYYWRVYPYDTTTEELGTVSDTYTFTISATGGEGEGTAINGVVYERSNGEPEPLSNAIVNIYNETYSDQVITGSNGFYLFEGLDSTSTYSIQATKTDYDNSEIQYVTPAADETTTKNILLQKRTDESQYYSPHYVSFTLKSFSGMVYDNVDVDVFREGAATATFESTTGADGAVSFKLDQNQQYELVLYSDEHGIDTTYTVTPRDTHYDIYVKLWDSPTREEDNVEFKLMQKEINLDSGYINATWNDTSAETTSVSMWINDTNNTNLFLLTDTNSIGNFSQEVDNNATYLVKFQLESTGLTDTFTRTGTITFNAGVNDAFDLGFSEQWHYSLLAALIITLIATFFGVANAHAGGIIVVLGGWFMIFIGWLSTSPVTVAMLVLATLLSVGFYLRKGEAIQ